MSRTIIYAGNFELPDKNAAAHRVVNNAKLFRLCGIETVFLGVCRDRSGESCSDGDGLAESDHPAGFKVFERAYPATLKQWASEMFDVSDLAILAEKYHAEAVMLYNMPYSAVRAAVKCFSKKNIRVFYDCTEWNGFTEGNVIKRAVKKADSRLIESRLASACDGLICVSRTMLCRYSGEAPVLLLPPLTDINDPVWSTEKEDNVVFTFCYAGSPSDKDRLDVLTEAFSRLDAEARLEIVGVSEEEFFSAGQIDRSRFENVEFLGRLSHDETVKKILSCDCFIFLREPTRRNSAGFPTKFAEAFTCGVPIITTDVSDVRHYADEYCEIIDDISASCVVDAMRRVVDARKRPAGLRSDFHYANYVKYCGSFFERTLCPKD